MAWIFVCTFLYSAHRTLERIFYLQERKNASKKKRANLNIFAPSPLEYFFSVAFSCSLPCLIVGIFSSGLEKNIIIPDFNGPLGRPPSSSFFPFLNNIFSPTFFLCCEISSFKSWLCSCRLFFPCKIFLIKRIHCFHFESAICTVFAFSRGNKDFFRVSSLKPLQNHQF